MTRLVPALRLHFVAWPAALAWPWAILALAFAVNLGIFGAIGDTPGGSGTTGALTSVYICTAILYITSMTQMFSLALGMSLTRKAFYSATTVMALAQALGSGIVIYLLEVIEDATGGWGVNMTFFGVPFMQVDNPILQILVYAGPFLLLSTGGMLAGTIFKRWGQNGVWIMVTATTVIGGGAAIIMTWQHWWVAFGQWFADQSAAALFVGYCGGLAIVLGAVGYGLVRKVSV